MNTWHIGQPVKLVRVDGLVDGHADTGTVAVIPSDGRIGVDWSDGTYFMVPADRLAAVTVRMEYSGMRMENDGLPGDSAAILARMCERHGVRVTGYNGDGTARGVNAHRSRVKLQLIVSGPLAESDRAAWEMSE